MNAKIAFIILTWNSLEYVDRCLGSVLGLEGYAHQVLIHDNGSTDGTLEHLKENYSHDPHVSIFSSEANQGTTVPRNKMMRIALEDQDVTHLCVLDSDTIVNVEAFEEMLEIIDSDPSIAIAGPEMDDRYGTRLKNGRNFPTATIKFLKAIPVQAIAQRGEALETPSNLHGRTANVDYLLGACWLVPRKVFETIGLLDERIFYAPEDVDFCLRAHYANMRVVLCRKALIIHDYQRKTHQNPFSSLTVEHVKGLGYYFRKHRYLFNASKAIKRQLR